MIAKGKEVKMNDFLTNFEEKFGQPKFFQTDVPVYTSTISPCALLHVVFPQELLDFARARMQVRCM